jgi:type I restriction enzyme M protein
LVFRRPVKALKSGKAATKRIWFYEVQNDGFDPDKVQGGTRPETPDRNDIPGLFSAWTKYKSSGFKILPGIEANTILPPENERPKCWWATFDMVKSVDFNLTAGRYKPQIGEKISDEDPVDLISEVLGIEKEITAGLKTLLRDVESAK